MVDSLFQSIGGTSWPFVAADVDDNDLTLQPLDPALAQMLGLFSASITAELEGPTAGSGAWSKVCAALPSDEPLTGSTTPVADTLELEPTDKLLKQRETAFPFLAIHRVGDATVEDTTLERLSVTQQWWLHYVLGPLAVGGERKLLAALQAVAKIVSVVIDRRGHPAYQGGALQFFSGATTDTLDSPSSIGAIHVVNFQSGGASFGADTDGDIYHALRMTLETVEYDSDTMGAYTDAQGCTYKISVGNRTELVPDMIIADTDFPGT